MPTSDTQTNSTAKINFRLSVEAKEKIERAAIAEGLSVTDFAVHTLVTFADEVLERHHTRTLSDRDRDIFLKLLDADEEPNEALKSAFEAHRELIK